MACYPSPSTRVPNPQSALSRLVQTPGSNRLADREVPWGGTTVFVRQCLTISPLVHQDRLTVITYTQ